MAGKNTSSKSKSNTNTNKKEVYGLPSRFGSHWSMVNSALTKDLKDDSLVVCTDEYGNYTTNKNRLDSGLADTNRYTTARLEHLCVRKATD